MKLGEILSESAFWAFSIDFYSIESNKDSLLRLQDEAELNVNIILILLYMSLHDIVLTESQLKKLLADISELDSLTSHIREARKQVKQLFSNKSVPNIASVDNAEYKGLLEVELSLEKRQQKQLISTLRGFDSLSRKDNATDECLKITMTIINADTLIKALVKKELKTLSSKLIDVKQKQSGSV